MENARAGLNTCWQKSSLSGLHKNAYVRRWLWSMWATWPPRKRERERAMAGTDGMVCTISWGSEYARKRRTCPKRELVKEKGTTGHQQGLKARTRHVLTSLILLAADYFRFSIDLRSVCPLVVVVAGVMVCLCCFRGF